MEIAEVALNYGVPGGLLGFIVIAIFRLITTGSLVPRITHDDLRADRDSWREAAEKQQEINRKLSETLQKFAIQYGATTTHALNALPTLPTDSQSNQEII